MVEASAFWLDELFQLYENLPNAGNYGGVTYGKNLLKHL